MLFYKSVNFLLMSVVYLGSCSIFKNLKHFDILHSTEIRHQILKRGLNDNFHPYKTTKKLHFTALGRDFQLILTPNKNIFHSNFQACTIDSNGKEDPVTIDRNIFYEGSMFGVESSNVNIHLEDGVMTATIILPEETYHIEPSWRHIPQLGNESMIAYRDSDVVLSWDGSASSPCGHVKEWSDGNDENELDDKEVILLESDGENRVKRGTGYEYHPIKSRCPLLLVADYRFYKEMGGSNSTKAINYLVSLINNINMIYNKTVWQDGSGSDGIKEMGFVIKKIIVHWELTSVRDGYAHYNMDREKWNVGNFLEVFSRERSHKDYCLAFLFTYRKFEGGKLGFAYVASPRLNAPGGICTPDYIKNGCNLYLNSGVISSHNNYGHKALTKEAILVAAHEFGHSWGAEHDPQTPECTPPASQGGSFLMYPHTYNLSTYNINNKRFSPCSLKSVKKVLLAKSGKCFVQSEEYSCGNSVVEDGEECDAGFLGVMDRDACCDQNCKLRGNRGAICSDKNSACCKNCKLMGNGFKCRNFVKVECEHMPRCTGTSSECPKPTSMIDGSECLERGKCQAGKCVPFCESRGYQSCTCDSEYACKRCCRKSLRASCIPVSPYENLPDRTHCFRGFCYNGVCEVTSEPEPAECF